MHHIYHTEGIILSSRNYKETDKYYAIFTRDLGMIYASAQGIRKISSKLRFVLQDFSYLKIDLVKGKDFWRITSVSKTNKLENLLDAPFIEVFVNLTKLLRRLLTGEEPNEILFADLVSGLSFLEKGKTKEELRNIEIIIVLRILHNLGYIEDNEIVKNLVKTSFNKEMIEEAGKNRTKLLHQINKALKETHL